MNRANYKSSKTGSFSNPSGKILTGRAVKKFPVFNRDRGASGLAKLSKVMVVI